MREHSAKWLLLGLLVVGIGACSGEDGMDGEDRSPPPLMVESSAAGENCPAGGTTFSFGYDTTGDGEIDDEVSSHHVCDGEQGDDGRDLLVETVAAGDSCPAGGITLWIGYDTTGDGSIDDMVAEETICDGVDGSDGQSVLVETEDATSCENGGTRFLFGYDTTGDGSIDDVTAEETVCDGEDGESLLVESSTTVGECLGIVFTFGYDTNGDGAIDEITSETEVCTTTREAVVQDMEVLLYVDFNYGDSAVEAGLTTLESEGLIELTVASSWTEARDVLNDGSPDIAVILNQGTSPTSDFLSELESWVEDGHPAIASSWNEDSEIFDLMEASAVSNNQAEATFTSPLLSFGLPSPLELTNQGWLESFSRGMDPVGEGVSLCIFEDQTSCAVHGNQGRTLMLGFVSDAVEVSDGRQLILNALTTVLF